MPFPASGPYEMPPGTLSHSLDCLLVRHQFRAVVLMWMRSYPNVEELSTVTGGPDAGAGKQGHGLRSQGQIGSFRHHKVAVPAWAR